MPKTEDFGQGNSRDAKQDLASLFSLRGRNVVPIFSRKKKTGDPNLAAGHGEDSLGLRVAGSRKIE